ncbi:LOW QUALITY PROTEIN: alanine--glyoxylate aminotransferase [Centruroides vittatus]|uniref:LOW QUALITY PROTEIN: alanine--glyoxylate aminotransferase n=1 Tax=Centruroides vittatus TaxID=120091 RepID=UPI0035102A46
MLMEEYLDSEIEVNKVSKINQKSFKQRYRTAWETDPVLKDWIQPVPGKQRSAFCKFCKVELVSHKKSLEDHAKTVKHAKCAAQDAKITSSCKDRIPVTIVNLVSDLKQESSISASMTLDDDIEPPLELLKPFSVPKRLLLGPGPSNCPPQVLEAAAQPLLGHLHPEFLQIMEETKEGIKYAFQTRNTLTFAVSGTGHCAMEAALCNLLEPDEAGLFVVNGHWGKRAADVASRHGARIVNINIPFGSVCDLEILEKTIIQYNPSVLFICHGESSTGVLHPLEGIGKMCHKYNCLLIVDAVASLGAVPIYTDKWEIDVIYSGSQKVLGAPPGSSPMSFSPRAVEKIKNRNLPVQSYYMDALLLGNYWNCDIDPPGYHHTGPISNIYALREALSLLAKEKLEACWKRHKQCAELLYRGLEKMGLELFVEERDYRLPTVTTIRVPEGINWKEISMLIMKKYGIEISGGLGPTAGLVWRIGLMGYNCKVENVNFVLNALKAALNQNENKL